MSFGKILTAMVTPFNDNGEINFQAVEQLVNHLIENGSDGIVVAGTTGESPTLTYEEKIKLFEAVVSAANKRATIIAGTGTNNTKASIELTKKAEQIGVDGIMLVAPYYNKPSQEGLYAHFAAIAKETTLPVMIYNIPGRSAVNISVETTVRLSKIDNIVATKEASGDVNAMAQIVELTDDRFSVYSGDDSLTLPSLAIGSKGVVSVASHIIGNEMKTMIEEFLRGNVVEAASLHRKLLPIMTALFAQPSPAPVKAALNMKGIPAGSVRLPLVPLTKEQEERLKAIIETQLSVLA